MRSTLRLLLPVAIVAAVAGCGGDDDDAAPAAPPRPTSTTVVEEAPQAEPPFATATATETLVDSSRPAGDEPERQLLTTIGYPAQAAGPFPLLVFAHGLRDHPRDFSMLTSAWAAAGYVVASPAFPLTSSDVEGEPNPADFVNQPGDVSLVIDELIRLSRQAGHPLEGLVDEERIGVAGHGLGVVSVLAPAYHSCCRDSRIGAAVALSGILIDLDGSYDLSGVPILLIYGAADEFLPAETGPDIYARAQPPKLLVTITDGTHWPAYRDEPDPADELVIDLTTRFWDHHLRADGSFDDLVETATDDGLTTVMHDAG